MSDSVIRCVVNITSAFVAHNHIRSEEMTGLIAVVHAAVVEMERPKVIAPDKPKPAVDLPWKKTIRPEYIISLIDGKHYKTLRRHLGLHGLTPDEYRARYELPADYPMVSSVYSQKRSALAKETGLGQRRRKLDVPVELEQQALPDKAAGIAEAAPTKPARGRAKKVAEAA